MNVFYALIFMVLVGGWVLILGKLWKRQKKKLSDKFPEPWGLPLLGHLLFLENNPAKKCLKWKQKLGPVFQLNLAGKRILVLNDVKSISECFAKEEFAGRSNLPLMNIIFEKCGLGLVSNQGPQLREQRHFFLKAFRECGIQKKTIERAVSLQITRLIENWEEKNAKPFKLTHTFTPYTLNTMWNALASEQLADTQTTVISKKIQEFADMDGVATKLAIAFPWFVRNWSDIVDVKTRSFADVTDIVRDVVVCKDATRVRNKPRDVMDKYLDRVDSTVDPLSAFHPSQDSTASTLRDIIGASTETTAATLSWFVLQMLHNPKIAGKLQDELDTVVGRDRLPSLDDRAKLPFSEACVMEILRWSSVIPIGVPHCTTCDTEFRGHFVPEGTLVIGNLYAVHHDPDVWDEPESFCPERFLTGKAELRKLECAKILPFGTGKRVCLGIGFIVEELFLFVTGIYHQFTIIPYGRPPSLDGVFGFEYIPAQDPEVIARRR